MAAAAVLVAVAVILVRFVGVFAITYVPRFLSPRIRARDPYPPWSHPTFVSMAGLRGAVSLAAALALPRVIDGGAPFPERDLIVFCTFIVILATLVLQGLSLPYLIRWTSLEDDGVLEREASKARIHAADAALARLEELADEDWVREDTAERMRGQYRFRRNRFAARFDDGDDGSTESRSRDYQRLRRELLAAEQDAVVDLRRRGVIGDEAMNVVQHDIDLESTRLDV